MTVFSTKRLFAYTITNTTPYVLDSSDYSILESVFNRWDELITPDSRFEGFEYTIEIAIKIETLALGILGGASISNVYYFGDLPLRFGDVFPANGNITLNYLYISGLKNSLRDDGNSEYYYVMLHEVGHVLGIGPFWELSGAPVASYLDNGITKYYYTGVNALREYKSYFSPMASLLVGIPIEDDGGSGTAFVHPEEGTESYLSSNARMINGILHPGLDAELMTGWLDSGPASTPLSRITIGFLEDMGYGVNYNITDYYRVMSEWLDLSYASNCFKQAYIQGFLDISGGSIITRGTNDGLVIGGDSSLNGTVYLGDSIFVRSDGIIVGTADNGASAIYVDVSGNAENGAAVNPDISGNESNGAAIIVSIPSDASWSQLGADIDGERANDQSGVSVSLSADGQIVAIGAYTNDGANVGNTSDNRGHVRVYQYINSSWTKLGADIDGEAAGDYSGYSVSLSADGLTVAIGAYLNDGNGSNSGHVRVYKYVNSNSSWTKLGFDIDGENVSDISSRSVSLSDSSANGIIVAIGAFNNDGTNGSDIGDNRGHMRVYQYDATKTFAEPSQSSADFGPIGWRRLGADIDGERANDQSGVSVSLSADGLTVAIGAYTNDGTNTSNNADNRGHVRVYKYDATKTEAQPDQNVANFGPIGWNRIGADIDGEAASDNSGWSVSLSADGTIVAIGARENDGTNTSVSDNRGHVRVYKYRQYQVDDADKYHHATRIQDISNQLLPLIITGDTNSAPTVGQSYWTQLGVDIDGERANDLSGYSVSLSADGQIVAIGAYQNDGTNTSNTGVNRGHVCVYKYLNNIWTKLGADIDGEAAGDLSGFSVSLSANGLTVAIGARLNDGTNTSNTEHGHVRVYEITTITSYADVSGGYNDVSQISGYNDVLTSAALYVNGGTDISGNLTVSGAVAFNAAGSIFVAGDLSLNGTLYINSFAANSINADAIDSTADIEFANKLSVSTADLSFSAAAGLHVATDFSLNNALTSLATNLTVPANIAIVDGSNGTVYGSYLTLTNKDATAYYNVGKSASGIFNIVNQSSAGVYLASGGTSFTGTSDARLKTNVVPLDTDAATAKIMALNPCTYQWKSEVETASPNTNTNPKTHIGFIAQEVEQIMPELVHPIDHPAGPDYKGVNTTDMIPYLVSTIQEQTNTINALEQRLEQLKQLKPVIKVSP